MSASVNFPAYYQFPKLFFSCDKYKDLSTEAKVLYTLMRDRYKLSLKNNWRDALGVFIRMTRKAICALIKRSEPTVRKIIAELVRFGLISEKRVGLTQCNKIYVKPLDGEDESAFQSRTENACGSAPKPSYAPERNAFSPSKNSREPINYRKLTSRPERPRAGDVWEENGELYTYNHGYTQRYYKPGELERLCGVDTWYERALETLTAAGK